MSASGGMGDGKIWVWIPDETHGFVDGEVVGEENGFWVVKPRVGDEIEIEISDEWRVNPSKFDKVPDMSQLTFLNEASVLHNLKMRYQSNFIYTYSGLFLVAVNPYRLLPIYRPEDVAYYNGKRQEETQPHVYALSDHAYRSMMLNRENQSMLITGESGAGKTENTKKVLQYLAAIAGKKTEGGNRGVLEEQVIQANPILEAFGNAKTLRNNNSSRFGKFIEIQFTSGGQIAGATIESYLLEKSRVVVQMAGERNYHIFYQLLAGLDPAVLSDWGLEGGPSNFNYTKVCTTIDHIDDAEEFRATKTAFDIMGVSNDEQMTVYRICAAILHLGNVEFVNDRRQEQASVEPSSRPHLEIASRILGLDLAALEKSILNPRIKAGREWVSRNNDKTKAVESVEALVKALFERLFKWLVTRINKSLENKSKRELFIGVLDISGFEIFEVNSFEQLCINYTNEKLQQFFNTHMFKKEQEEYMNEGIQWQMRDYGLDLQDCIDLIELKHGSNLGLLTTLDDACSAPNSTTENLVEHFNQLHSGSVKYKANKYHNPSFTLSHYAGDVTYDCTNWLDKNKDLLMDPIAAVMKDSSDPFIPLLFLDLEPAREGGKGSDSPAMAGMSLIDEKKDRRKSVRQREGKPTVATAHRTQLDSLMSTLQSTNPHFIRCIKPNEEKKPGVMDAHSVLEQLRCNGVLEGIRICREGFPNRLLFMEFVQRYGILAKSVVPEFAQDVHKITTDILKFIKLDPEVYRVGKSKVFFKAGELARLEDERDRILGVLITKFQAVVRGYFARKRFGVVVQQARASQVLAQAVRNYLSLRHWGWWQLLAKLRPMLKHTDMEAELAEREAEMKALKRAAKEKEDAAAQEKRDAEAAIARLEKEKEAKQREREETERELKKKEESVREKEETIGRLEREAKAAKDEVARLSEDIKDLEEDLRFNKEALDAKVEQAKKDKAAAERAAEAAEAAWSQERARLSADAQNRERTLTEAQRSLEKQLADAKAELETQADRVAKLSAAKKASEGSVAELTESLAEANSRRSEVEAAKRRLEAQLAEAQDSLASEGTEKDGLGAKLRETQGRLDELVLKLDDKERALAKAEKDKADAGREASELADRLAAEEKARSAAEKNAKATDKALKEALVKLEEEERAKGAALKAKKKAEAELKEAQEKGGSGAGGVDPMALTLATRQLEGQIRELREALAAAEAALATSERGRRAAQASVDDLTTELEDEAEAKAKAERRARIAEDALALAREEAEDEAGARSAAEKEAARRAAEIEQLRAALARASSDAEADLSSRKTLWEEAMAELREANEESEKARSAAEKEARRLKGKLDEKDAEIKEAVATKGSAAGTVRKLEAELASLKETLAEKTRALAAAEVKANGASAEAASAVEAQETATRALAKAERDVKALKVDLNDAREAAAAADASKADAEKALRSARAEANTATERAEEAEAQIDELKASLAAAKAEAAAVTATAGSAGGGGASEDPGAKVAELTAALRALQAQLTAAREELETERNRANASDRIKRQQAGELEDLRERIESESAGKASALEARRTLESELRAAREATATAQQELLAAQVEAERATTAAGELEGRTQELIKKRQEESRLRKDVEAKLKAVEDQLQEQVLITEHIEKAKRRQQEEIEGLKEELEDESEARAQLESVRREHATTIAELHALLDSASKGPSSKGGEDVSALRREIDDLQAALAAREKELSAARKEAKDATAEARAAKAKLADEANAAKSLKASIKRLKAEATDAAAALVAARSEASASAAATKSALNEVAELRAHVEVLEKAKANLEVSKRASENQLEDLRDALALETKAKTTQINRRRELEKMVESMNERLSADKGHSAEVDELKRQHILAIAAAKTQVENDYAARLEATEASKATIRVQNEELRERLSDMERELASGEASVARAQKEAADARGRLDNETNARIDVEKANRNIASEMKEVTYQLGVAKAALASALEEKAALAAQLATAIDAAESATRAKSQMEASLAAARNDAEILRESMEDATLARDEAEDALERARGELEEAKDRAAEFEDLSNSASRNATALEAELSALQDRMEAAEEARLSDLESTRKALLAQVEELTGRVESEEKQKFSLEKTNRRLDEEVQKLTDDKAGAERAAAEARGAADRAASDLELLRNRYREETKERADAVLAAKRLELAVNDLTEQLAEALRARDTARDKRREADEKAAALRRELSEETNAVAAVSAAARELQAENDELRDKVEESEARARINEEKASKLNANIDELHAELARTDATNVRLEKDNQAKGRQLRDLLESASSTDGASKNAVERIRGRLEGKIAELNAKLSAEAAARTEANKEARAAAKEAREAKQAVADLTKAKATAEKALAKADARAAALRDELDEATAAAVKDASDRRKLQREVSGWSEEKDRLEKTIERLEYRLERERTTNEEMHTKLSELASLIATRQ